MIDVTYFYDDVDLAPTVAQQARFVDEKGQEIAPIKVNMVRRDIDLATMPISRLRLKRSKLMVKHISYNQLMIKKLSHTNSYFKYCDNHLYYKEVTEGTAENL